MTEERRRGLRVPLQMWVEESHEHATYFQRAGNLSSGGIFLEHTIPHPLGTVVQLQFTLPGDEQPIRVRAEIVNAAEERGESAQLGMGMRFVDLPPALAARINQFIAQHG
jgi:uncharacterized protein (TIGR02266 family)